MKTIKRDDGALVMRMCRHRKEREEKRKEARKNKDFILIKKWK